MSIAADQILHNRYRVDYLLQQRDDGVLYQAMDLSDDVYRVLKVYEANSAEFTLYATRLSQLDHPNLAAVSDYFLLDGQKPCLVMELFAGQTVAELIQVHGALSAEYSIGYLSQICDALTYLHSRPQPLINGNVDTASITILPDGKTVLSDYGLFSDGNDRWQRDLQSLAVVLVGLLGGQSLAVNDTSAASEIIKTLAVSAETKHIIQRALSISAHPTFESVAAFQDALLASQSVHGAMPVANTPRYKKGRPVFALLLIGVLFTVGIASANYIDLLSTLSEVIPIAQLSDNADFVTYDDSNSALSSNADAATATKNSAENAEPKEPPAENHAEAAATQSDATVATSTPTNTQAPTNTPQATSTPMPTPTPSVTPSPVPSITPTPSPRPTATATPPTGVTTFEIGTSVDGQAIFSHSIGDGENALVIVGGMHAGFAPIGGQLAEALLDHYTANQDLIPENAALYIIPNINPDALYAPGETQGRLNRNGVDLNRNWGCNWQSRSDYTGSNDSIDGGSEPFSEPETAALRDFFDALQPASVIYYSARARTATIYRSVCNRQDGGSSRLATNYRSGSSDQIAPTLSMGEGESADWLAGQNIPAIYILLDSYDGVSSSNFERALSGVQQVLDSLGQ